MLGFHVKGHIIVYGYETEQVLYATTTQANSEDANYNHPIMNFESRVYIDTLHNT